MHHFWGRVCSLPLGNVSLVFVNYSPLLRRPCLETCLNYQNILQTFINIPTGEKQLCAHCLLTNDNETLYSRRGNKGLS